MSIRISVAFAFLTLLLPFAGPLAEEIGSFTATQPCPLYQSKRNSSNPGNLVTTVNGTYPIVEALPPHGDPTWLRVKVDDSSEPRWVQSSCGTATFSVPETETSCHLTSTYDSHVLAISWQPGFCKDHSDKPECAALKKEPFASSHFTLHGLWPNRNACGTAYDFCGEVKQEVSGHDFCQFPEDQLDPAISALLARMMPSVKYGTCLDRHEWWKHGTCRDASANTYFLRSMNLLEEINGSTFVEAFIQPNIGKTITRADLAAAFDKSFGQGASKKLQVNCGKGNTLSEIQINLPKDLGGELAALLADASDTGKGSCKNSPIAIVTAK